MWRKEWLGLSFRFYLQSILRLVPAAFLATFRLGTFRLVTCSPGHNSCSPREARHILKLCPLFNRKGSPTLPSFIFGSVSEDHQLMLLWIDVGYSSGPYFLFQVCLCDCSLDLLVDFHASGAPGWLVGGFHWWQSHFLKWEMFLEMCVRDNKR